eukprot:TRINITY_DN3049_c0_g1::TRINITY_DN3049_c0_g1_i1::g.22273::m.22273 TRINITY_DN3049_c0_g1::TRINITY_DN3049_c0_g1_i1::g.22273  ORF type:complete len:630 (+),score=44.74,DUF563/PF04577.9/8.9e-19 TRINITY_DN3049_c0_g1_i1:129-2018(+)
MMKDRLFFLRPSFRALAPLARLTSRSFSKAVLLIGLVIFVCTFWGNSYYTEETPEHHVRLHRQNRILPFRRPMIPLRVYQENFDVTHVYYLSDPCTSASASDAPKPTKISTIEDFVAAKCSRTDFDYYRVEVSTAVPRKEGTGIFLNKDSCFAYLDSVKLKPDRLPRLRKCPLGRVEPHVPVLDTQMKTFQGIIAVVKNATINSFGGVRTSDGVRVGHNLHQLCHYQQDLAAMHADIDPLSPLYDTSVTVLTQGTSDSYFQKLIDILPRSVWFSDSFPLHGNGSALHVAFPDVPYPLFAAYPLVGALPPTINPPPVLNTSVHVATAVVPPYQGCAGNEPIVPTIAYRNLVMQNYMSLYGPIPRRSDLRLTVILIENTPGGARSLVQQQNIINHLKDKHPHVHFDIYPAEGLSLKVTIEMFARAHAIISPFGDGLTNMMFSWPGTRILEIAVNKPFYLTYYSQALKFGHHWYGYLPSNATHDDPIDIVPDELKKLKAHADRLVQLCEADFQAGNAKGTNADFSKSHADDEHYLDPHELELDITGFHLSDNDDDDADGVENDLVQGKSEIPILPNDENLAAELNALRGIGGNELGIENQNQIQNGVENLDNALDANRENAPRSKSRRVHIR